MLKGVDFQIDNGSFMGLLGPNGSGKSTLLYCLSGGLRPFKGSVELQGRDIRSFSHRERARRIAVMPQESEPLFDFTVHEFVSMGRYPHMDMIGFGGRGHEEAVGRALAFTGLRGLAKRSIKEMSGGERRRAVLARALAQEPSILLLDEPTKDLDIRHSLDTLDLVRRKCHDEGLSALAVLHDLDAVLRFCDRAAILDKGRITAVGRPDEVISTRNVEDVFHVRGRLRKGRTAHFELFG